MLCRVLCAFLFVAWTAERIGDVMYYANWRSPFQLFGHFFVSVPGIRMPPWEILLLLVAPLCFLRPGAFRQRPWPMDAAILVSLATVALTFFWGLARGGSAYQSYWQLHNFLSALLMGALLLSVVRNPGDVKALGLTILAAALVRATLATYFFVVHVRGRNLSPYPMFMTSHADSLLFAAGVLVALCWAFARMRWTSWLAAAVVVPWLLVGMKVNNRRSAWIELAVSLVFGYLLLRRERRVRRRVNRWMLAAAPLLVVYVVVGWNRPGPLFAPLRAVSTTTGEGEDVSSIARNEESMNLVYTYLENPLLGTGWGHPYREISSSYTGSFGEKSRFWQYPFLPHNSLVGIAAFGGVVGLVGIWLVVPMTAFLASGSYRRAARSVDRAASMAALCFLPAYGVDAFAYISCHGLTSGLLLSVAMATAGKVSAWTGAWPTRASRSRAPATLSLRPVPAPGRAAEADRRPTVS
jgi:O-Antigen ligase